MRKYGITFLALLLCLYGWSQTQIDNSPIYHNNGNVGIGTSNPSSKLHVVHANDSGVKIKTDNPNDNTAKLQVLFNYNSTAADRNSIIELGRDVAETHSYKWRFRANSTHGWGNMSNLYIEYLIAGEYKNYMAFKNDGNVGIGITNPSHKLTVDGTISAKEVKVSTTPNSDYVFEPDYPLLPLSEVEAFIKENKHLPHVPSAESFKQNGVGLGEMDDMLLRKVEELTLYVLELKKENEELRREKAEDIHRLIERIELIENR